MPAGSSLSFFALKYPEVSITYPDGCPTRTGLTLHILSTVQIQPLKSSLVNG